mmetsp:Transcript_26101/g.80320  ORF Transcript_26101/g.80320 Transcript_26101/m.80320 type:complete len:100 (-) Transcript_26101:390-689(-)
MGRVAVALALFASAATAFQAPRAPLRRHVSVRASNDDDPTKVWYAELANGIQNLLTNSPLNEGKKAVVKMLAGPYDEAAVNAKLDGLLAEPVVMLSFTK